MESVGKFKGPVYVLQYERLKNDMATELTNLAGFLNISVQEKDIACTIFQQEGRYHRKSNSSKNTDLITRLFINTSLVQTIKLVRDSENILKERLGLHLDIGGDIQAELVKTNGVNILLNMAN